MTFSRVRFSLGAGLLALGFGSALTAQSSSGSIDLSGKTDASIKEVLHVVAHHQVHPLKDADYAAIDSLKAATTVAPPEGIMWNYPWGVTLYGVIRSTDFTGDQEAEHFVQEHNHIVAGYYAALAQAREKSGNAEEWATLVKDYRRTKIGGLLRLGNLDNCGAMGVETLEEILRHPESTTPDQKAVIERVADWISNQQDRLPDGTFWRPKAKDQNGVWPEGTIWIDDLYMACPFLVRWSKYTHDPKYLTDAAHQLINMASRVQDTDGVWFHAYSEPKKEHSPFKWGRANGWAMIAAVEILSEMPENHPLRSKVLDVYRRQVAGVIKLQPASGVWKQVLDKPELWEETSCTCMFAYSIARGVNRGWIPAEDMESARKGFAGVAANYVTPEGVVKGTCQGTDIGFKLEYYANRQRPDDDLHGRGVVLLAGAELLAAKK